MAKSDISSVYIEVVVNADGTVKPMSAAQKAFFNFRKETSRHRGLGKSIATEMTKMAGGLFAAHRAVSLLSSAAKQMFTDVSAFQRMSVELKVATGSAEAGEAAFSMLQNTAKKLPSSIQDLTEGFVRLKNMGLDASENSLISFSNTAAAMGKSLKQFVEGVADANTREFERLKEFGILARNQGSTIRVTFRGITKDIENSSKSIVGYLTDIGNKEFAGAATEQINTLSSRVTKLKDALFALNISLGKTEAGAIGDFMGSVTKGIEDFVDERELSKFEDRLTKVMSFKGPSAAFMGPIQMSMERIPKTAEEIKKVFEDLNQKDRKIAEAYIKREEKLFRQRKFSGELSKKEVFNEETRLAAMRSGLAVAIDNLNSKKEEAKRISDIKQDEEDIAELRKQNKSIDEALAAFSRDRRIEVYKQLGLEKALLTERDLSLKKLREAEGELDVMRTGRFDPQQVEAATKKVIDARTELFNLEDSIRSIRKQSADEAKRAAAEIEKGLAKERELKEKLIAETNALGGIDAVRSKSLLDMAINQAVRTKDGLELQAALEARLKLQNKALQEAEWRWDAAWNAEQVMEAEAAIEAAREAIVETEKAIEDAKINKFGEEINKLFDDIKEGIADAIVEGENFKGVLQSILKQIAKTQILGALTKAFPGLGTPVKGAFKGGPVTANRPFLVGERGPELFVPSNSGSITPNHRMGGGTRTVNVVNNFSIDGGDRQEMQQMIASSVSASVSLAVNKMQDNKRRGIK